MTLLETEKIEVAFGGLVALSGVDIHIEEGEILGIIGPNGAGKTTLFNVISGVYKPLHGRVLFNGDDITGWRPDRICRVGVSRTFQLVRVFPTISALQNVMVGVHFGRSNQTEDNATEMAWLILETVGLQDRAHEPAGKLNLATRKRLEVARALATEPHLLMLDEVIAGLNPTETEEMMALIRSIRDSGVAILLIEHVMKVIMTLSDRVVVLHHGVKIAEGTPNEVSRDPEVVAAYLGKVEA